MDYTRPLFDKIKRGEIIVIYSNLLEKELQNALEKVKEAIKTLPSENVEYIEITDESIDLAQKYVDENVVGKSSFENCLHIVLATLTRADIIVNWNFKHIVNVTSIRKYNC